MIGMLEIMLVIFVAVGIMVPPAWPVIPFGAVLYLLMKKADDNTQAAAAVILSGDDSDGAFWRHWFSLAIFAAIGLGAVWLLSVGAVIL